ncbi:hypothetical protein [Nocardia thailandica]|uniref:hypothetical protein n=1 Tax=Nocardia thailandica TaxID=257275 RepID=UPI0012F95F94|nr:hypothetical protein [Nocardia thailandica]
MFDPTPIQARLLQAVQNLAADNWREAHRNGGDGELSTASRAHIDLGDRARRQLEQVATAVGVPAPVLAYHRAVGERGQRYRPGQALLSSDRPSREDLLAGYQQLVHELQDRAGDGAAAASQNLLDRSVFAAYRQSLGAAWQRVGAIGHVLDLNEAERAAVWTRGDASWLTAVAEQTAVADRKALLARVILTAAEEPSVALMPLAVLNQAGVTAADIAAQMPMGPDEMVERLATALRAKGLAPGTGIDAAIAATGIDTHTGPEPGDPAPDSRTTDASPGPEIGPGL